MTVRIKALEQCSLNSTSAVCIMLKTMHMVKVEFGNPSRKRASLLINQKSHKHCIGTH